MTTQINDGGPAFPSHGTMGEVTHEGASLRDYFAAKALVGLLSHQECDYTPMRQETPINVAIDAYKMADAMLAARVPNQIRSNT